MALLSVVIRYPDQAWEARTMASIPAVGETLAARGSTWRVEQVEQTRAVPAVRAREAARSGGIESEV